MYGSNASSSARATATATIYRLHPIEHDYSTQSSRGPCKVRVIDQRTNLGECDYFEEVADDLPPWMCKEEIVVTDPISQNEEYLLIDNNFLEEQEIIYHRPPVKRRISNRYSLSSQLTANLQRGRLDQSGIGISVLDDGSLSSDKNRFPCRMCGMLVAVNLRKMHVYRYHLNRPLYECPLCEHASTYHVSNVKTHMRIHHAIPHRLASPINRKEEFAPEIAALMHSCFGDDRMFTRTVPQSVKDVVEYLLTAVSEPDTVEKVQPISSSASSSAPISEVPPPVASALSALAAKSTAKPDEEVTCNLCGITGIKQRGRHVLQHHVKKPVFRCPLCDYATTYASSSVKDHLRSQHAERPDARPADFRWNYQNLIDHYFAQCFY
uniref:C2H2-type domain-containing protein n=1 Tax=Plectus sambesii TaxID=2011161 RepID=A0A914WCW4_9BILA